MLTVPPPQRHEPVQISPGVIWMQSESCAHDVSYVETSTFTQVAASMGGPESNGGEASIISHPGGSFGPNVQSVHWF